MRRQEDTSTVRVVLLTLAALVAGLVACDLVLPAGQITFTADRTSLAAGECTTLRWHVPNENNVLLNGQSINPSGQMDVCPAVTTTYQLRAGTGDNIRQQEITIAVDGEAALPPPGTEEPPGFNQPPTPANTPLPSLSFTFNPTSGPPGSDVELYLSAPLSVEVYFDGRVLPKRVLAGGSTLSVTIPGNASSGYFELRYSGRSVRAAQQFVVTTPSATLTLSNNSGQTVCYVYISPSDSPTWGDDWLGSDVVPSGGSYVFSVPPGSYDLMAENCSSNEIDTRWSVSLSGSYSWSIAPVNATVTLYNNSGQTIWYVYISPSDSTEWGSDWLGSEVVPSGSSHVFSVPPGTYDLKADDSSHNVIDTRWSVILNGSYSWSVP